jgi:site-specific DNA-methyltransferase (adenine-specific)
MNEVHYSSASNEWQTPPEFFKKYDDKYHFELDAAATDENALCKKYFTEKDNALVQDWSMYKTVWMNPPYGRILGKFVKKAYEESLKGVTVVCLVPSRTCTTYWHNYCMKGDIYLIKGRLKFVNRALPSWRADGNFKRTPAPFPSAVIIFNAFGNNKRICESYFQ